MRLPTRHSLIRLAAAALIALSPIGCRKASAPTAPAAGQDPAPAPGPSDPLIAELATLVNQHRASMGLGPLAWDARVAAVAQAHSQDMVDRDFFSHTNPDGESPFDRLARAGITYAAAGENIAYGFPTASSVLTAWLGSPGHRSNIEYPGYTHHGVGLVGTYWTHVFIRPPTAPAAGGIAGRTPPPADPNPPPLRKP